MKEIEKNPKFNGLRVRTITDAGAVPLVESHPSHPNRKAPDEIPPSEAHGGLRMLDHGKHELVHDHPDRRHPQSASLAALGSRERE
jgi:hypothetical protein